jgi:hypothetical protein
VSEDEQEALSCKYVMPRVMRLTSGRFAMFSGLNDLRIYEAGALIAAIPGYDELPEAQPKAKPGRKPLNLTDLIGL